MESVLRRKGYAVRSRKSKMGKASSVGQIRSKLAKLGESCHYFVGVAGHVMLLDNQGKTVVDTDPRKRDKRAINRVYAVYKAS